MAGNLKLMDCHTHSAALQCNSIVLFSMQEDTSEPRVRVLLCGFFILSALLYPSISKPFEYVLCPRSSESMLCTCYFEYTMCICSFESMLCICSFESMQCILNQRSAFVPLNPCCAFVPLNQCSAF